MPSHIFENGGNCEPLLKTAISEHIAHSCPNPDRCTALLGERTLKRLATTRVHLDGVVQPRTPVHAAVAIHDVVLRGSCFRQN